MILAEDKSDKELAAVAATAPSETNTAAPVEGAQQDQSDHIEKLPRAADDGIAGLIDEETQKLNTET